MKLISIEPFIPSGSDFEGSKQLFLELGFRIIWEQGGYTGLQRDACKFILQNQDDKHFAENLMIRITVDDLDEFWREISDKELANKFKIRLQEPTVFPYGREVHLIDLAGVCWHFGV